MRHPGFIHLATRALALGALAALPARAVAAQEHAHPASPAIPMSMRAEHREIHESLERATKLPGRVGAAARELAAVLHPHFVREEQIALPPLGLLAALARGDSAAPMRGVLPMTDSLRAELPRMLEEHVAIRAATMKLRDVARAERNASVVALAEELARHARSEEELFYPAAVLVGDVVRMRLAAAGTAAAGMPCAAPGGAACMHAPGTPCPHMGAAARPATGKP
jgi:hypothetical protein